jgi:hypothetical protein
MIHLNQYSQFTSMNWAASIREAPHIAEDLQDAATWLTAFTSFCAPNTLQKNLVSDDSLAKESTNTFRMRSCGWLRGVGTGVLVRPENR